MACPYFDPTEPWDPGVLRVSLGQAYRGSCGLADAATSELPPETQLHVCNAGYARGRCEHFPADERVDAVRFSGIAGQITWIEEADHSPLAFGLWLGASESVKDRQARAFARSIEEGKIR